MLRKKGLTRYNPFKEFPTKYEEGENILTKSAGIVIEKYDSAAETVEQLEIRLTAKYGTFIQLPNHIEN